jgi:hypothetical protein
MAVPIPRLGVLVQAAPRRYVLILLPMRCDPSRALEWMARGIEDASWPLAGEVGFVVALNASAEGLLCASKAARRLGVARVHAVDERRPVDVPGVENAVATSRLEDGARCGDVVLARASATVLHVGRVGSSTSILVGTGVTPEMLERTAPSETRVNGVLGAFAAMETRDAVRAIARLRERNVQPGAALLLPEAAGAEYSRFALMLMMLGWQVRENLATDEAADGGAG